MNFEFNWPMMFENVDGRQTTDAGVIGILLPHPGELKLIYVRISDLYQSSMCCLADL